MQINSYIPTEFIPIIEPFCQSCFAKNGNKKQICILPPFICIVAYRIQSLNVRISDEIIWLIENSIGINRITECYHVAFFSRLFS